MLRRDWSSDVCSSDLIAKRAGRIAVPKGARLPSHVELEVRVDSDGAVREVRWAGGAADTALIAAAIACARGLTFYPALRGGTPVEVWCRQRFDFPR
jgi:outer membrane biosynthesis protein TonB